MARGSGRTRFPAEDDSAEAAGSVCAHGDNNNNALQVRRRLTWRLGGGVAQALHFQIIQIILLQLDVVKALGVLAAAAAHAKHLGQVLQGCAGGGEGAEWLWQ